MENTLDTNKLEAGMIVKNYKQLCALLGEEIKDGNSKKAQLAEWERYFSFEKQKNKQSFIILKIYEEPKDKEVKIGRPSVYLDYIEAILVDFLARKEGYTETMTKKNWWKTLGMVNENYTKDEPMKYLEENNIIVNNNDLDIFFRHSNFKLDSIFMNALKSLENRRLIFYHVEIVIHWNNKYSICNEEEEKEILSAERYILCDVMGYSSMKDIYKYNKQKIYFKETKKYVHDMYGYDFYFRQIKIIYNQENMISTLLKEDVDKFKRELNHRIMISLIDKDYQIALFLEDKFYNGEIDWLDDRYQEKQYTIAKVLIKLPELKEKQEENTLLENTNEELQDDDMGIFDDLET